MSTPIKIAELERLDAAATPGPWSTNYDRGPYIVVEIKGFPRNRWPLLATTCGDAPEIDVRDADGQNAALIPAMRNALPALLRLARAAKVIERTEFAALDRDEDIDELRAALSAFDFTEEPSA